MSPKGLKFREARDSIEHPLTLPIMVWLDVTGSMGRIPENLVKGKLGTLMNTIISHDVKDPAILFGAIGDHYSDTAPLQVGQFESGNDELDKWLTSAYLEGNGGGQHMESYLLSWLIAARHTSTDHFEKRHSKGLLFTIGDEATWDSVSGSDLCSDKLMGYESSEGITAKGILEEAQRSWEVFHLHIQQGQYRDDPQVIRPWKELLGERLILIEDYETVAEVIATTVALFQGIQLASITKGFDAITAGKVHRALNGVSGIVPSGGTSGGVFKF